MSPKDYAKHPDGSLHRLKLKPWRGKSERRKVLKARRLARWILVRQEAEKDLARFE